MFLQNTFFSFFIPSKAIIPLRQKGLLKVKENETTLEVTENHSSARNKVETSISV